MELESIGFLRDFANEITQQMTPNTRKITYSRHMEHPTIVWEIFECKNTEIEIKRQPTKFFESNLMVLVGGKYR